MTGRESDLRFFWDRVTRERMSEVGEERPFDFLYRGEFDERGDTIRGVRLGNDQVSADVDMVNVDMESFYIRMYEIEFGPEERSFEPGFKDYSAHKLSDILDATENDWRYKASKVFFDPGENYRSEGEDFVQGSVYWPESTRDHPETVYRDVERIFGEDILSQL